MAVLAALFFLATPLLQPVWAADDDVAIVTDGDTTIITDSEGNAVVVE
ncbi:MAG: hypothetical protein LBQ51_07225 [Desulfovibrio sp.]|jgi:hypothetical protein|nr:hypothetical protein [Desulfovibrio sp.]